jgi:hypothetical protein
MRITDQYFWNIIFTAFFLSLVISGTLILEGSARAALHTLTPFEFILLSLAAFRLTRLFVYDKITAFFREQFYDAKITKTSVTLQKPTSGPRRTIADLLSCPWCFGAWAGATVVFFYALTPYAWYPILMLAVSGVASMLQVFSNVLGWKAEQLKHDSRDI